MRPIFAFLICVLMPASSWAANLKVAVLEFAHEGKDAEWAPLGKGFQEMLLVDLSKAAAIDVVERRAVREQRLALGVDVPGDVPSRAKLGKEAGATHLLSGTFAVSGDTLTLTAELLAVGTGELLYNNSVQGEAEAFFELEKEVVNATIGSLKLSLGARERAETARLHTADFLAFQDFSAGLDHFDAERYEASLTALRKASERDTQFSLASITLGEYEDLVEEIRGKADAIAAFRAEEQRLESLSGAGETYEVYKRLLELAALTGKDNVRQRLTAMHTLALAYEKRNTRNQLFHVAALQDEFAKKRASDELAKRFHKEALTLWPQIPVQVHEDNGCGVPELDTFERDFQRCIDRLWERGADYPENRRNYLLNNLRYPRNQAARMHLTLADEIRLHDTFMELSDALQAPDYWVKSEHEELIKSYRWVLRFDDSTRLLKAKAKKSDNQYALKGIAEQVEDNKEYVEAWRGAADTRRVEEWMMLSRADGWSQSPIVKQAKEEFSGKSLSEDGAYMITRVRDWPSLDGRKYLLVGNVPTWCHQHCYWVWSGPRDDPRHTDSVRFYKEAGKQPGDRTTIFIGSFPRTDFDASFRISWTVPDDFVPRKGVKVEPGRKPVELLFGLNDLDVPKVRDPDTNKDTLARPMFGYAALIGPDELRVSSTVEVERGGYKRKKYDDQVLTSKKLKKSLADGTRVDVSVRGRTVFVRVGNTTLEHKLKDAPSGFLGLRFGDDGFAEVSALNVAEAK